MLGDRIIWANNRHLGHDVRLIPAQYVKPYANCKGLIQPGWIPFARGGLQGETYDVIWLKSRYFRDRVRIRLVIRSTPSATYNPVKDKEKQGIAKHQGFVERCWRRFLDENVEVEQGTRAQCLGCIGLAL